MNGPLLDGEGEACANLTNAQPLWGKGEQITLGAVLTASTEGRCYPPCPG